MRNPTAARFIMVGILGKGKKNSSLVVLSSCPAENKNAKIPNYPDNLGKGKKRHRLADSV